MSVSDYEKSPAEVVLAVNNNNNSVRKRQRQRHTDRQTDRIRKTEDGLI